MLNNPYIAAAWSYFYRLRSTPYWVLVVFIVAANSLLLYIFHHQVQPRNQLPLLLISNLPLVVLASIHARQSIIDAKARLRPHGVFSHVVILCLGLFLFVVGETALLYCYGYAPLSSLIAVTLFVFVAAACMVQFGWWVCVALPFSLVMLDWLVRLQHPWLLWAMPILAIIWLAIGLWRLSHADEQSWGTITLPSESAWRTTFRSTQDSISTNRSLIYLHRFDFNPFVPGERVINRAIQNGRSSAFWTRCRRWQITISPAFPLLMVLLMASTFVAIQFFIPGGQKSTELMYVSMQTAMMLSVMISLSSIFHHRRFQSADILKPITREAYIRELGASIIFTTVRNMISTFVIVLLFVMLATHGQFDLLLMLKLMGLNIFLAIFAFGINVWFLRYSDSTLLASAQAVTPVFFMIAIPLWADARPAGYRHAAMAIGAILALGGIYLTRDAYRRWMMTDLQL